MLSIYKSFLETANVPCQHPSGLVAPFGFIDPSNKSKKILLRLQNITLLDPNEQKQRIEKETKEVIN